MQYAKLMLCFKMKEYTNYKPTLTSLLLTLLTHFLSFKLLAISMIQCHSHITRDVNPGQAAGEVPPGVSNPPLDELQWNVPTCFPRHHGSLFPSGTTPVAHQVCHQADKNPYLLILKLYLVYNYCCLVFKPGGCDGLDTFFWLAVIAGWAHCATRLWRNKTFSWRYFDLTQV